MQVPVLTKVHERGMRCNLKHLKLHGYEFNYCHREVVTDNNQINLY